MLPLRMAARIAVAGGVIAYPTEGVFGFGCRPDDAGAVLRILDIKQRDPLAGLVLIAASEEQLDGWIELPNGAPDLRSSLAAPVTWVVPATAAVPPWIRGRHPTVAVRITEHPVARGLCEEADMPLVSTSANVAGRPPARTPWILRRQFRTLVDYIVPGHCGPAGGPSEIRDIQSGRTLRPSSG